MCVEGDGPEQGEWVCQEATWRLGDKSVIRGAAEGGGEGGAEDGVVVSDRLVF